MKIPAYLREPQHVLMNYDTIARVLQIEAKLWRREGNRDAARALEDAATRLKRVSRDVSPAEAFEWPSDNGGCSSGEK